MLGCIPNHPRPPAQGLDTSGLKKYKWSHWQTYDCLCQKFLGIYKTPRTGEWVKFDKTSGYKVNTQKSVITGNWSLKKKIPLKIVLSSQRKHLGENLTKWTQGLCAENYTTPIKSIRGDLDACRHTVFVNWKTQYSKVVDSSKVDWSMELKRLRSPSRNVCKYRQAD